MTNTLKIPAENARDLTWCDSDDELGLTVVQNKQVGSTRWSSVHELVVQDKNGDYWWTMYLQGLTEYQDEEPFEYQDEVEFQQAEPYEVTVTRYRSKDD